ncbi:radical SAM protein [Candidatus Woesearchaeota archaeon]|nr:radical SAM protein [Candidatus Woesearchaeota archaeon]
MIEEIRRKEKNGFILFDKKNRRYFFENLDQKEIDTIYEKGFELPLRIQWRITKKCNLNCKHCYLNKKNLEKEELSKEELITISKLIVKNKIFEVLVTGGEPTIKEGIKEIIPILCENCNVTLFTNVYNSKKVKELLPLFKKYRKTLKLNVSLDGPKKIHDFIRKEGSFEKTTQNIKRLTDNKIDITINTTLTKQFLPYLEEYIEILKKTKVKALQFSKFYPLGEGENFIDSMLSPLEFKEVTKKLISLSKKIKTPEIVFDHTFCFLLGEKKQEIITRKCSGGFSKMIIESNGDVYPCQLLPFKKFKMGNILKDNLKDIWNSKNKYKFIKDFLPEECKSCNKKEHCLGGCKASSYSIHKTFKHKDPYCFYER